MDDLSSAVIIAPQRLIAVLWAVDRSRVSQILSKANVNRIEDRGYNLAQVLDLRPTALNLEDFEAIVSGCICDAGDPVEASRAQALHEFYFEEPRDRQFGNPELPNVEEAKEQRANADLLSGLRATKLQSEIEYRRIQTRKAAAELVERKQVEKDLKAAGTIIQNTLKLLPMELAIFIDPENRAEAQLKIEESIERCLYSIITALGGDEEHEED